MQEVWPNSQYQRWKHWRDQGSHENEAQITSSAKFCLFGLPYTLMDVLAFRHSMMLLTQGHKIHKRIEKLRFASDANTIYRLPERI